MQWHLASQEMKAAILMFRYSVIGRHNACKHTDIYSMLTLLQPVAGSIRMAVYRITQNFKCQWNLHNIPCKFIDFHFNSQIKCTAQTVTKRIWCSSLKQRLVWFRMGNLRERDYLEDPGLDGRIILRWIFRKWEGVVGTGWTWFRIRTGGWRLWVQ